MLAENDLNKLIQLTETFIGTLKQDASIVKVDVKIVGRIADKLKTNAYDKLEVLELSLLHDVLFNNKLDYTNEYYKFYNFVSNSILLNVMPKTELMH